MAALLLTDAELRHFGAKGWVLRERVLTPSECQRLIGATDREQNRGKGKLRPNAKEGGGAANGAEFGRTEVDGERGSLLHSHEEGAVFRDGAVCHPRLAPALAQLVGGEPQLNDSNGPMGARCFTTRPHPRRADPAARAALTDHRHLGWHRGIRPRWGTRPAELPSHILCNWGKAAHTQSLTYM